MKLSSLNFQVTGNVKSVHIKSIQVTSHHSFSQVQFKPLIQYTAIVCTTTSKADEGDSSDSSSKKNISRQVTSKQTLEF